MLDVFGGRGTVVCLAWINQCVCFCLYRGGCDFTTRVSGCVSNGDDEWIGKQLFLRVGTVQSESVTSFLRVLSGIKRAGNMFTT